MSRRGGGKWSRGGGGGRQQERPIFTNDRPDFREQKRKRDAEAAKVNPEIRDTFLAFQSELDYRHDKYERIVKQSRDITIESKRVIFQLHRVATAGTDAEERKNILEDAGKRLDNVRKTMFRAIAQELKWEDPHQYLRAFTPGLQEFTEAVAFFYFLLETRLVSRAEVALGLIYPETVLETGNPLSTTAKYSLNVDGEAEKTTKDGIDITNLVAGSKVSDIDGKNSIDVANVVETAVKEKMPVDLPTQQTAHISLTKEGAELITKTPVDNAGAKQTGNVPLNVAVPTVDYLLGVGDIGGELMRYAINSVSARDLEAPKTVTEFMRKLYDAYVILGPVSKDMGQKLRVLRQSLLKVERSQYALRVRGSEVPEHKLADLLVDSSRGDFCDSIDMQGEDGY